MDNLESNLKPFLNKAPKELEQNVSLQLAHGQSKVYEGSGVLLLTVSLAPLQLSALERAELHGVLAEAHAALFAMYLQAQGANPEDHPFAKEKVRGRAATASCSTRLYSPVHTQNELLELVTAGVSFAAFLYRDACQSSWLPTPWAVPQTAPCFQHQSTLCSAEQPIAPRVESDSLISRDMRLQSRF